MRNKAQREARLAILASHPIQYYAPLYRELSKFLVLQVYFAHKATPDEQARAGFGKAFEWDIDLTSGYSHEFLENVSSRPGINHFSGCNTPEIERKLRKGRYDALLVMGWHLKSFLQGIHAAKCLGIPVLVRGDSHLNTPRSLFKRMAKAVAYPPFLRIFDAALYVGQRSRLYYEHYHYPSKRLFYSPHCVNTEWFAARATLEARLQLRKRLGISSSTAALLFAGKLVPFKRPLDLIIAVARCRARGLDLEVIIAGDGELQDQLLIQAKNLNVPMHFLGFCNQSEMPSAYAAADCLVLPSDGRETWGLVANEALACGRPIIVSDACGCAPDLAGSGRAGRIFHAKQPLELARCIEDFLADPPSRAEIHAASSSHSLDVAVTGILEAVETTISTHA